MIDTQNLESFGLKTNYHHHHFFKYFNSTFVSCYFLKLNFKLNQNIKCAINLFSYRLSYLINSLILVNITAHKLGVLEHRMLRSILIENQQTHQNDNLVLMSSQTLLHVSTCKLHHQQAHTILTCYSHFDVHYLALVRRNM
jgi:hypothetical protein